MQVRHKRHQHMMRKAKGGAVGDPPGYGYPGRSSTPSLVSGNKNVVAAAKSKKSIGEVDGIYSKARLDKKSRGNSLDKA